MHRRVAFGILASGGVLFVTGAAGLTPTWSLVVGTLLLTAASVLLAIVLEARDLEPWTPPPGIRRADVVTLERAA